MFATKNTLFAHAVATTAGRSYDNSAISAHQSALASGTAFTWTQTVATGSPYGLIAVFGQSSSMDTTATPVVSLGGVSLSSLGSTGLGTTGTSFGFAWFFGAASIPSGSKTASVQLTESSKTFTGYAVSLTYNGCTTASNFNSSRTLSTSPSVTITTASGDIVVGAIATFSDTSISSFSLTQRQYNTTNVAFIIGDATAASTTQVVSATIASDRQAALGVSLA